MSLVAKSLSNVTRYTARWADRIAKRINRLYDDRDQALADALRILEARSDSYYPAVTNIDAVIAALDNGAALTDLVITGTNFIGDMEKASGSTENSTAQLTFTAILPGEQTITVTFTDTGAALGVTADADAGTVTIVYGDGGGAGTGGVYTAAEVKAALDAHEEASYMIVATIDTAGDMDADESVTVECTAADPGTKPVLNLGTITIDGADAGNGITYYSDTEIIFNVDATSLTAGEVHFLRLWIDDVLVAQIPLRVAGGAASSLPQRAIGTIASADVLTLFTTPVELVAAPGAGKFIAVDAIHWFLDHGGTDYTATAGKDLAASYTDGSGDEVVTAIDDAVIDGAAADLHVLSPAIEVQPVVNAPVVAHVKTGNWADGDGDLKYEVIYRVMDIDPIF